MNPDRLTQITLKLLEGREDHLAESRHQIVDGPAFTANTTHLFVYCPGTLSLKLVLYFIANGVRVTLVTNSPEIVKLCEHMNWEVVFFSEINPESFLNKKSLNHLPAALKNFFKARGALDAVARNWQNRVKDQPFCFTVPGLDMTGLYLIHRLKGVNLFFRSEGNPDYPIVPSAFRFSDALKKILYRTLFGFRIRLIEWGGFKMPVVTSDFFRSKKICILNDITIERDVYEKISFRDQKTPRLFLADGSLRYLSDYYDAGDLSRLYMEVVRIYGSPLCFKQHPGSQEVPEAFRHCRILPSYVPAEFYSHGTEVAIAVVSSALVHLAGFSHIRCVSLVDLIKPKQTPEAIHIHHQNRQFLIDAGKGRVHLIQDLSELKKL